MTDQHAKQLEESAGKFTLAAAVSAAPPIHVPAPQPDEKWELTGGTAWVYLAPRKGALTRPVIMADGFNLGPTNFDALYNHLEKKAFPLISTLLASGRDVIILGFHERTDSILKNADAAMEAITRANKQKQGDARLAVGGFSMGGIITRHALAQMEKQGIDHQTGLYFSYDSPHRGSWIPIALQAFAHFIPRENDFATQMNSDAARQMMWRHYNSETGAIEEDPLRKELQATVGWPAIPHKIAVANGSGRGTPNGVKAGVKAVSMNGLAFLGTVLNTQSAGPNRLVADMKRISLPPVAKKVHTDDLPELDGAPGGTLEGFGILADALNALGGKVIAHERVHGFVPSVSAVSIQDIDVDPYVDISTLDPKKSDFDEFRCASQNEPHTAITEELCTFIIERLPD